MPAHLRHRGWRSLLAAAVLLVGICLALLVPGGALRADNTFDRMLMPGPLASDHAEFEDDCGQCHYRDLEREDQKELCVSCHDHENIAIDLRDGTGLHGRDPQASKAPCRLCHADHLGRDAALVTFDPETFDHRYSDFELEGRHALAACSSCHRPNEKWHEAPDTCHSCHESDDVHAGELGEACGDCHKPEGWERAEFDHDLDTDWPLEGAHADVTCELCHAEQRYEDTPTECVDCHRINDVHGGRYGAECETCHLVEAWDETEFDHDSDTDWPLRGRHDRVECDSCHTGHLYDDDLGEQCIDCHREDDVHRGRNGEKCADCHSEKGWVNVDFDHERDTDFPRRGRHEDLQCVACHRGQESAGDLSTSCVSCHRADDVHRGAQGEDCASCHSDEGWGEQVRFDHDITRFPLIGQHAVAPCEACHLSASYSDVDSRCEDCHADDDIHEARLGEDCARCHNPNDWLLWHFDHDRDTDFELLGRHVGLDCHACHVRALEPGEEIELSGECYRCHQADDVHRGRFGRRCDRCHVNESFEKIKVVR